MLSCLLIVRANLRLQIDTQFYRNIGGREPRSSSNVGSGSVSVNSAPSVLSPIHLFTDVPDHTTLYRFLKRLEDDTLERGLGETVRRLRRGKTHGRVSATVDGTGLSPQAVSTYFLRRSEQQNGGKPRYRHYLKWLVVVDVKQQVVLAQQARQGPWVDTRALPGLVDAAARCAPLRLVLADAAFDSEANHQHIRQRCGAQSIIPAQPRRGVPRGTLRSQMYRSFPQKKYAQRAKVETIFSAVKRKLSSRAPGRSLSSSVAPTVMWRWG